MFERSQARRREAGGEVAVARRAEAPRQHAPGPAPGTGALWAAGPAIRLGGGGPGVFVQRVPVYWAENGFGLASANQPDISGVHPVKYWEGDNRDANNGLYKEKSQAYQAAYDALSLTGDEQNGKFSKDMGGGPAGAGKYTFFPDKKNQPNRTKVVVNHLRDPEAKLSFKTGRAGAVQSEVKYAGVDHYHAGFYNEYLTEDTPDLESKAYTHWQGAPDHLYNLTKIGGRKV